MSYITTEELLKARGGRARYLGDSTSDLVVLNQLLIAQTMQLQGLQRRLNWRSLTPDEIMKLYPTSSYVLQSNPSRPWTDPMLGRDYDLWWNHLVIPKIQKQIAQVQSAINDTNSRISAIQSQPAPTIPVPQPIIQPVAHPVPVPQPIPQPQPQPQPLPAPQPAPPAQAPPPSDYNGSNYYYDSGSNSWVYVAPVRQQPPATQPPPTTQPTIQFVPYPSQVPPDQQFNFQNPDVQKQVDTTPAPAPTTTTPTTPAQKPAWLIPVAVIGGAFLLFSKKQ